MLQAMGRLNPSIYPQVGASGSFGCAGFLTVPVSISITVCYWFHTSMSLYFQRVPLHVMLQL